MHAVILIIQDKMRRNDRKKEMKESKVKESKSKKRKERKETGREKGKKIHLLHCILLHYKRRK